MHHYLIIYKGIVFLDDYYDHANNYAKDMTVVNLYTHKVTYDGITWNEIEVNHL
jgi:hypothetical protein